jgi:hypothetical protein
VGATVKNEGFYRGIAEKPTVRARVGSTELERERERVSETGGGGLNERDAAKLIIDFGYAAAFNRGDDESGTPPVSPFPPPRRRPSARHPLHRAFSSGDGDVSRGRSRCSRSLFSSFFFLFIFLCFFLRFVCTPTPTCTSETSALRMYGCASAVYFLFLTSLASGLGTS